MADIPFKIYELQRTTSRSPSGTPESNVHLSRIISIKGDGRPALLWVIFLLASRTFGLYFLMASFSYVIAALVVLFTLYLHRLTGRYRTLLVSLCLKHHELWAQLFVGRSSRGEEAWLSSSPQTAEPKTMGHRSAGADFPGGRRVTPDAAISIPLQTNRIHPRASVPGYQSFWNR